VPGLPPVDANICRRRSFEGGGCKKNVDVFLTSQQVTERYRVSDDAIRYQRRLNRVKAYYKTSEIERLLPYYHTTDLPGRSSFTTSQAAAILGVSLSTVHRLCKSGKLTYGRSMRHGSWRRISANSLRQFVAGNRAKITKV
jgi:excisionase family DNA binding protein